MPPRKKRVTKRPVKIPAESLAEDVAEDVAEESETLDVPVSVFDSMEDDSYVVVLWKNPDSKQYEYQGRLDAKNATEAAVQEMCGGGRYTLREMARDETGRMMYRRQRTVTIGGPHFEPKVKPPKDDSKPEVHERGELPAGVAGLTEAITAQIINLMNQGQTMSKQQFEGMAALFEMIRKQGERPQDDGMLKLLLAMMQQQTTLLQAMMTGKHVEQPDPVALIEKLSSIVRNTSGVGSGGTVKDVIDSMESVMNIKLAMSELGSGPPEDPIMRLATTYLPKFFELAQSEKDKSRFVQRATAMLPASTTPQPQPQTKTEGDKSAMQPWQQALHAYRRNLLAMAQMDSDPEIQATALSQMLPMPARSVLRNFLANDNAFPMAMEFLPELQPYGDWAGRFFQTLHMEFFPDLYDDNGELIAGGSEDVATVEENVQDDSEVQAGFGEAES